MTEDGQIDASIEFFAGHGYEVRIEQRDLHAKYMASGEPGRASSFAEGRRYHCVDLLQRGEVAWSQVAHDDTAAGALAKARRWFER